MKITPNYHFNGNCEEALKLYEKAFNGKLLMLMHYCDANPKDMHIDNLSDKENPMYTMQKC
jgi:PhnB protein